MSERVVRGPGVSVLGLPNFFNEIVALDSYVRIFPKGRFYSFKLILLQCKHAFQSWTPYTNYRILLRLNYIINESCLIFLWYLN